MRPRAVLLRSYAEIVSLKEAANVVVSFRRTVEDDTDSHGGLVTEQGVAAGGSEKEQSNSADGWEDMLLSEIERQQKASKEVVFRAGAAFAKPEIHAAQLLYNRYC